MSKVQCVLCFENCTTEGRGGEKGGSANSKTKHTEPLTLGQYHGEEEGIWENISTDRRVSAEGSTEHRGGAAPEVRGRSRRANEAGGEIFCLYARL